VGRERFGVVGGAGLMLAVAMGLVVVVFGVSRDGRGRAVGFGIVVGFVMGRGATFVSLPPIVVVVAAEGGELFFGPTFRAAAGVFIELVTGTAFPLVPPPPTPEGAIEPLMAFPYPLM
jgi:hypothetical protein